MKLLRSREGMTAKWPLMLNRIQRVVFHFAACCVALSNAAVVQPVQALSAPGKTVLVLYGDPLSVPADRMTEQGLTAALSTVNGSRLQVFTEYLDLTRFPAAQYGDDLVRLSARSTRRERVAKMGGAEFLNAGSVVSTDGVDGLHLTSESEKKLGAAVCREGEGDFEVRYTVSSRSTCIWSLLQKTHCVFSCGHRIK